MVRAHAQSEAARVPKKERKTVKAAACREQSSCDLHRDGRVGDESGYPGTYALQHTEDDTIVMQLRARCARVEHDAGQHGRMLLPFSLSACSTK